MDKNLDYIIGMTCTYKYNDEVLEWNDDNTIKCRVIDIGYEIDDDFPYSFYVLANLEPIGEHNIPDEDFCIFSNVSMDNIIFN